MTFRRTFAKIKQSPYFKDAIPLGIGTVCGIATTSYIVSNMPDGIRKETFAPIVLAICGGGMSFVVSASYVDWMLKSPFNKISGGIQLALLSTAIITKGYLNYKSEKEKQNRDVARMRGY